MVGDCLTSAPGTTRRHHPIHGRGKRVVTGTDVRQIDHDHVDHLEILHLWREGVGGAPVQGPHVATGDLIANVRHRLHVLCNTVETVLRCEKAHQRSRMTASERYGRSRDRQ